MSSFSPYYFNSGLFFVFLVIFCSPCLLSALLFLCIFQIAARVLIWIWLCNHLFIYLCRLAVSSEYEVHSLTCYSTSFSFSPIAIIPLCTRAPKLLCHFSHATLFNFLIFALTTVFKDIFAVGWNPQHPSKPVYVLFPCETFLSCAELC